MQLRFVRMLVRGVPTKKDTFRVVLEVRDVLGAVSHKTVTLRIR